MLLPLDEMTQKIKKKKEEVDNATPQLQELTRGLCVLTFHFCYVSCPRTLASLQASRKCNKIKGCVLSSRVEELKGRSPRAWSRQPPEGLQTTPVNHVLQKRSLPSSLLDWDRQWGGRGTVGQEREA